MAIETELKLALTPATARQLPAHPLLAGCAMRHDAMLSTYYDTPQQELAALGVVIRLRKKGRQWLFTVKSTESASGGLARRQEWECPTLPDHFEFACVDDLKLRRRLAKLAPRCTALFTTRFRRTAWLVDCGASRIELALDRGRIESNGRQVPICELELELVNGEVGDLFVLARRLQDDFDLRPMIASKAERGYAVFTGQQPKPCKAAPTILQAAMTPVGAFRQIALNCLAHLQRNELTGPIHDDPEYVHQARIALRRMRSALKLFAPLLPQDFVEAYGDVWKTLAGALGEARNWDVFIAEILPPLANTFPGLRDIGRLRRAGKQRSTTARQSVKALFVSPEYARVLLAFTALVLALPEDAGTTLKDFALQRLEAHVGKARRLAGRLKKMDGEARHALRIQLKKLRYTLEFFAPLWPQQQTRPYLAALAQLQEELGRINDHITARTLIAEVLGQRHPGPIHSWIAGRHALLLDELPEALATWQAQPSPWKSGQSSLAKT